MNTKSNLHVFPCEKYFVLFLASFSLYLLMVPQAFAVTGSIKPEKVNISLFYHGANLLISGNSGTNEDLIIKITAPSGDSHLKFKGKAGNVFWMKMGAMTFEPVPPVYMIYSTKKLKKILDQVDLATYGLGYDALKATTEISSKKDDLDRDFWFKEFIKLKEKDALYTVREGTIIRHHSMDGDEFRLEIDWPYQAPPTRYSVEVFAVKDGHVIDKTRSELEVKRAGIVAQLSDMAFNKAATYGLIAIVVAAVAGFGVGAVFKGGGSH